MFRIMKFRKRLLLIFAAGFICSQSGCAENQSEQLYVSFYGIGETGNPQSLQELLRYEPENADFQELEALYISGTQFQQYLWDGNILEGTVKSGEGDRLFMEYEDFTLSERSADMPDDYWEEQERSLRQYISDANETGGLICMYPSGEFFIHPDADGWKSSAYMAEWSTVPLYQRGGYLVTEQTEYTLSGTAPEEDFSLSCDGGLSALTFSSDGTWTEDGTPGGFWELSEDGHLLAVFSEWDEGGTEVTLLYVDFASQEVHIPIYMQHDKLLDAFHPQAS